MRENIKIGNGLVILNSIEFLEDLSIEVKWKICLNNGISSCHKQTQKYKM